MLDAVKNYLSLASGVTEVTRQRATAAAKALAASGEATAEQVSNLADDLVINSRNNRDAMLALVRYELDRALSRLGLATADEVTSLQRRVTILEGALALAAKAGSDITGETAASPRTATKASKATASSSTPVKAPARKTAAKATAARTTAAKASPSEATAAKATAAKATAAKATATKARAAKATATKTATKSAPAKKAAAGGIS